jgi:hypothetical protein
VRQHDDIRDARNFCSRILDIHYPFYYNSSYCLSGYSPDDITREIDSVTLILTAILIVIFLPDTHLVNSFLIIKSKYGGK